jgi:hypothetical protein
VEIDDKWVQKYQRDPDTESPAGGVSSSVNDLAKWMRLQLAGGKFDGKEIVNQDALAETHHPHMLTGFSPLNGLPGFYGLGWNVNYDQEGRLRLSHSGGFDLGAATNVVLVPFENLGVVVLTNAFPLGVAEGLASTFVVTPFMASRRRTGSQSGKAFSQMLAEGLAVEPSRGPVARAAAATPAYLGTYRNDFFGEIAVIEKEGGLAIVQGPKKMTFPMTHWDRDTFTYVTQGESSLGTAGITFTMGPDGKARRVLVENLNIRGEGVFDGVPPNQE